MIVLIAAAALAVAGVAAIALRSPVLHRIAARNAVRRRGETALVVLGAMLGTAIITGSLLVGDTLDASIRASAPNQLGPTDVVVRSATDETADQVAVALEGLSSPDVDGTLQLITLRASIATPAEDAERRAAPNAQLLEVDFAAAAGFGDDPAATGIAGATPAEGSAAISRDLADELRVGVGDRIEAHAYGTSTALEVDRIMERTGIAGFWTGFGSQSFNAFVAPGTVQELFAGATPELAAAAQPPDSLTLMSATGDVFTGAERSDELTEELESALDGIEGVEVDPIKQGLLDSAEEEGDAFSELFLAIGSFAVLAGVLLLVNIFVMLAEERKSELGMLRAVGMRLGTSARVSRINIMRAIRDLPEPAVATRRRWTAVLAAVVAVGAGALGAVAIIAEEPFGALGYPTLAALTLALALSRVLPRRAVVSIAALGTLVWGLVFAQALGLEGGEIFLFVLQGAILTFAAVALLSQNQETVGGLLRRLAGGGSLTARLGLAYPLARRFRTGMTLAMYSLVVFTLVFIAVLSQVFSDQVDGLTTSESGGFDILASASPANPIAGEDLEEVPGVASVASLTFTLAEFGAETHPEPESWAMTGIDETFVELGPPPLDEWDEASYADPSEVWQAVLDDPSLVVVDAFFLQEGGGPQEVATVQPGDPITIVDPATGVEVERTVAATSKAGLAFSGVMASRESVAEAVMRAVPNRYYVAVEDGADAGAVAEEMQGGFVTNGLEAESFRGIAEANTEINLRFFRLMQGYLALGLVVGIAGLGVIMVRAVRERRRQVGVLRSLGFQARMVRSAFLLESGFVALEGILVGTALALVTAYQVVINSEALGDFDVAFVVPWTQLAALLAVALLASLLATAAPAQQAARIRPAVALRLAD